MTNRTKTETAAAEARLRAMYPTEGLYRAAVSDFDGCHYVAEWTGSETGTRRMYRRTAQDHAWNRELTVCTRCGLRWADC